jgi:hypothetical protein
MYAFFRKKDKVFVGFNGHVTASDTYLYKDLGDINPTKVKWKGLYDSGELVDAATSILDYDENTTVYEAEVKLSTRDRILEKHGASLTKQINAMTAQISYMCDQLKVKKLEEFETFMDIVQAELKAGTELVDNMIAHPDEFTLVKRGDETQFLKDELGV